MKNSWRSIVAMTTLICLSASAQEPGLPPANSKAMLFSFSGLGNLNLNEFEGGIGGKYAMSDAMLIRAGMQFAIASRSIPANPAPGQTGTDGSSSATRFGVSGALEYHLTSTRISPYLGGGLGLSTTSTESKNAVTGAAAQTIVRNNRNGEVIDGRTYTGGTTISLFAMAGLEYFVTTNVSLAAEYRFGYALTSRYDEEATSGNTTVTTKLGSSSLFGISTGGVLTFAVYF